VQSELCGAAVGTDSHDANVSSNGHGTEPTGPPRIASSWLPLREPVTRSPMLESDADERLCLVLRIVGG